jgi:hypothetical protein
MRRTLIAAMAFVSVVTSVQGARAVFCDDGVHYVKHGYHANAAWPWPYPCPDRISVREPFCIMVNNGWRRQNLLGSYYFNANTNQLTTAGELRVQWIMTQAPPDRRSIFVERALDPETNTARMAVVRDYATKVSMDGQPPLITETYLMAEGRPASFVDATNVKYMQSMPAPVLPAATSASSTAGN